MGVGDKKHFNDLGRLQPNQMMHVSLIFLRQLLALTNYHSLLCSLVGEGKSSGRQE